MPLLVLFTSLCTAFFSTLSFASDKISPVVQKDWADGIENVSVIVHLTAKADLQNLDNSLRAIKATRQHRHEVVISELREIAKNTQAPLREELDRLKLSGDVKGYKSYWITNCFVVYGNRKAIESIANLDDVQSIESNFEPELIEPIGSRNHSSLDLNHGIPTGIRAVGAPQVWYDLGYTGEGTLIGSFDTGVDGNHPALQARWRGTHAPAEECWLNVLGGGGNFPTDNNSHGTHTTGTMCGNSLVSNDSIGVAPEAEWIACNAIGQGASGEFENDVLVSYEWFADPDGNAFTIEDVPDVVQNSWGIDARFAGFTDCFNDWNLAIIACEIAGTVVTFSAGNEGPAAQSNRSPATVAIDSVTMFSVGAVNANSDTIPPYVIADFSSRGPSDCAPNTAIKPEVSAPGVDVYSCTPGNNYQQAGWSGTSMAGPHVAGTVALMRQANPDADVRDIKSILMRTAHDTGIEGEDNIYGMGFIDAYAAVNEVAANRAIIRGYVTDTVTENPIEGAVVTAGDDAMRITDELGYYRMSVHADTTWTIMVNAFGYEIESTNVTVASGDTVDLNFELTTVPSGTINGSVHTGAWVGVTGAIISFPGIPVLDLTTDTNGEFTVLLPGNTTYTVVAEYHDATVDTEIFVPTGSSVDLQLYLESPRANSQGPDTYGYRAYDNLDLQIPPSYDWVEIAPAEGGPGQILELEARDSSYWLAMPFPLMYYGQTYDSISVNENGWISAGVSHDHSFANQNIPSGAGPSAMMALYWDNLHDSDSSSQICYWYDSLNCRVIIEYYRMQFLPAMIAELTCQAHIYSTDASPTPTGDNEILFLYQRNDVPNSCTIGIEDPAETIGVRVLYNDTYGANSWQIGPNVSILFTTRTEPFASGALTGNIIAHPTITDFSTARISLGCEYVMAQTNGTFSFNEIFTGVQTANVQFQGYESLSMSVVVSEDSTSTLTFEIWRLDPPQNPEVSVVGNIVTLSWQPPESVGGLDDFENYRIYRNGSLLVETSALSYNDTISEGDYEYYLTALYDGGESDTTEHLFASALGSENAPQGLPSEFALNSAYPNPFNATTQLNFDLPRNAKVMISVYDLLGRHTMTLANAEFVAGYHSLSWNASNLSTGLYFVQMSADNFHAVQKVMLLK